MAASSTKRRRVRQVPPDVLRAIREGLAEGASAPEVHKALVRRQGEFPADSLPSVRTISNIARDDRPAESPLWTVVDADPASVVLVLRVLGEVVRRTEGRVQALTQAEAGLLPTVYAAMEARWTKLPTDAAREWQAYNWTRFYLSWVRSEQDKQDAALAFAAIQTNGRWPLPRLAQVNRVLDAARAWLPRELTEPVTAEGES
jgi:hypothetical protein